ncbi:hypothetical protein EZV62_000260 [Acer yangbiense]|uniref:Uncharacterized protein n=1 Tax=Acer yangbiense TaxID=1000413 RepID=A0A5C7IQV1_9ROSI|nr:hypothetical protein EZV62_000260 [Acer yangbiense]
MKVETEGGLSTSLASEAEGAHIDDEGNVYSPFTKGDNISLKLQGTVPAGSNSDFTANIHIIQRNSYIVNGIKTSGTMDPRCRVLIVMLPGFEIAQMMAQIALSRKVFGKFIAEHGSFLADVAKELKHTKIDSFRSGTTALTIVKQLFLQLMLFKTSSIDTINVSKSYKKQKSASKVLQEDGKLFCIWFLWQKATETIADLQ